MENETEALFKVSKKKKPFRRRPAADVEGNTGLDLDVAPSLRRTYDDNDNEDDDDVETAAVDRPSANHSEEEANRDTLSVSEILRMRRQGKSKRYGIEFSNASATLESARSASSLGPSSSDVPGPADDKGNALELAAKRFAHQTGQISDANNAHMTSFIDAEMARLRTGQSSSPGVTVLESQSQYATSLDDKRILQVPERQPAALGRLQEIDLGPDSSLRNIEMTQEATRRLANGQALDAEDLTSHVTLGRDGKPRRRKRRRNSDDLKRDELVEAILRESKIEMYNEPEQNVTGNDDQAADDRIADEFRRQFLDAIQSRNNRRAGASHGSSNKNKVTKPDDRPRGPKLGGSRSARAAMRAMDDKTSKKH